MFPAFIPAAAQQLKDQNAIALLQRLSQQAVAVPDLIDANPSIVKTAVFAPPKPAPDEFAPLLLLHGFDSSLLEFRHLIPELEARWPTYAIDLLGFGFTAHDPAIAVEPRTIRHHLYYSWKALINRPVTLVGASLGGAIAIDFAVHHPACVDRLVLIDSVGFSGSFPLGKQLGQPLLELGASWLRLQKDTTLRFLKVLPFVSPAQTDLVLAASLHQEMPHWQEALIAYSRSGGYSDLPSLMARVSQPTLILWGDRDQTLGTQDARRFEQTIPHSRLIWVRGAGHAPHLQFPQAVAGEILKAISKATLEKTVEKNS